MPPVCPPEAGWAIAKAVGERRYVYGPESLRPVEFGRQALHAHRLSFRHPIDGRLLTFEAPLPEDMKKLLARLRRSRP